MTRAAEDSTLDLHAHATRPTATSATAELARTSGCPAMSKILASKDHENSNNQKSLQRMAMLGGAIGLAILVGIVVLIVFR